MKNSIKTRRLFFALWPTEQVRQSILDEFSQLPMLKGRAMRPHNLHATLHFLGQVTAEDQDCMHHAALSITAEAFRLVLDRFDYFSRAKIFWMGAQNIPAELTQLHLELGAAIENCGFKRESRPYAPHVTLLRKCNKPGPAFILDQIDFSIPWQVEDFVLVESVSDAQGVNYQVIEKYPLS
jgi:RNA 2',3'-cyclic 3'-phosphodiesterase